LIVAAFLISWSLPLTLALIHTAVAALIWLSLLYCGFLGAYRLITEKKEKRLAGVCYEQ